MGGAKKFIPHFKQINDKARGGTNSDRPLYISEHSIFFAEELANYVLEGSIPVTYTEAQTLITNSALQAGSHYFLTDKADAGILLLAVTSNKFSLEGQGIFLNPDYNENGVQSANMFGGWYAVGEGAFVNGNIVIWDGFHYEVTDSGAFAGTNPGTNAAAYTLLPKSASNVEPKESILFS